MAEEKKYAPVLPFDISYGEQFKLYDNMAYVCDVDICNASMVKMESGNVCKFYRLNVTEPVKIGGDIIDSTATEKASADSAKSAGADVFDETDDFDSVDESDFQDDASFSSETEIGDSAVFSDESDYSDQADNSDSTNFVDESVDYAEFKDESK